MFSIWWPAFLLPLAMVLGGVAGGVLPGGSTAARAACFRLRSSARRTGCSAASSGSSVAYAALAFMVMRTVRLVSLSGQRWFLIGAVAVEIIGAALMVIPVERTLHALFGEDSIVTEQAPAKINLALLVGEKHPDGYHDVTSVMQSVSLCDTVTARRTSGGITLTCSDPTLACDETNLAYRAAALFFEETGVEGGAALTLEKVIPMQAGLGGGSSDAAAVLRALRRLYAPDMPLEELERMAIRLGSDVPYCVRGATTLVEGRGEHLTQLTALPACWCVLCKPDIACPTGAMYGEIDRRGAHLTLDVQEMVRALERGDLAAVCALVGNVFEQVIDLRATFSPSAVGSRSSARTPRV
ncbi:MAG: 4-(cytidine 5'-diphospho)-2-C-methyl-D-erythritol kinase [Oscillospiraceae bacterium]